MIEFFRIKVYPAPGVSDDTVINDKAKAYDCFNSYIMNAKIIKPFMVKLYECEFVDNVLQDKTCLEVFKPEYK